METSIARDESTVATDAIRQGLEKKGQRTQSEKRYRMGVFGTQTGRRRDGKGQEPEKEETSGILSPLNLQGVHEICLPVGFYGFACRCFTLCKTHSGSMQLARLSHEMARAQEMFNRGRAAPLETTIFVTLIRVGWHLRQCITWYT